jgi:hypothetical protein
MLVLLAAATMWLATWGIARHDAPPEAGTAQASEAPNTSARKPALLAASAPRAVAAPVRHAANSCGEGQGACRDATEVPAPRALSPSVPQPFVPPQVAMSPLPAEERVSAPGQAVVEDVTALEPRSRLDADWNTQPHDPAQSAQVRSYLQETARSLALPPETVRSADCGETVCKVKLGFESLEQASSFEAATRDSGFNYVFKGTAPLPPTAAMRAAAQTEAPAEEPRGQPKKVPFELEVMIDYAAGGDANQAHAAPDPVSAGG